MSIRHQVSEGERSDVRWRVQALRDLCEEQPAGQEPRDPCSGRGPCRLPGDRWARSTGGSLRHSYGGRNGVAGVEEPRAQLGTSWGTSHEAESRLGLRMGGRRVRAGRVAGLQL